MTEVVTEVKDRATTQRLQVLPYELKFRQPSTEVLKIGKLNRFLLPLFTCGKILSHESFVDFLELILS